MATVPFSEAVENSQKVILFIGTPKENHCLWSDIRVDRSTLPDGWYAYDVRGNDDDGWAYCIEDGYVMVNHCATILTQKEIEFKEVTKSVIDTEGKICSNSWCDPIILDEIEWSFDDDGIYGMCGDENA